MRIKEIVLEVATVGSMALGAFGGIEMSKNSGAGANQDKWTKEQSTLIPEIINSLPTNLTQITPEEQTKIDDLRKQLSTVTQELSANKGSSNAESTGGVMLGVGAALTMLIGSTTATSILNRKRMDKFIRDTRLDGIPPHARWGGY